MRGRVDALHATARRLGFRRDVRPRLPVVARDVERAVVRAGPDHAGLERRLLDRVDHAVVLFARDVDRDRLTGWAVLVLRVVRRQVRRELLPRYPLVPRAVHVLRPVVDRTRDEGVTWE